MCVRIRSDCGQSFCGVSVCIAPEAGRAEAHAPQPLNREEDVKWLHGDYLYW